MASHEPLLPQSLIHPKVVQPYGSNALAFQVGIYRNADDGPCEAYMVMSGSWKNRIIDEMVVYNSKFQVG